MTIFLDEIDSLRPYKGSFYFPIQKKDRFNGSILYLMTPEKEDTIFFLKDKNTVMNKRLFKSYFVEKNIEYIISPAQESNSIDINGEILNESSELEHELNLFTQNTIVNEDGLFSLNKDNNVLIYNNNAVDRILQEENSRIGELLKSGFAFHKLKSMMYSQRMKNTKEAFELYGEIKKEAPWIKYTFVNPDLYKGKNLIYDWSYYTKIFIESKDMMNQQAIDLYYLYLNNFIKDSRFWYYKKKTVIIPVDDWIRRDPRHSILDYKNNINPVSLLYRLMKHDIGYLYPWVGLTFAFLSSEGFFTLKLTEDNVFNINIPKFMSLITQMERKIMRPEIVTKDSKFAIINKLADRFTDSGIKIHNLTGGTSKLTKEELLANGLIQNAIRSNDMEIKKAALVTKLEKVADKSDTEEDALKQLDTKPQSQSKDQEEEVDLKDLLVDIESKEGVNLNAARQSRYNQLQTEMLDKKVDGKTIKQLLDDFKQEKSLPEEAIPIDNIDDAWKHIKFQSFNKVYQMEPDIVAVFLHFTKTSRPLNLLSMDKEDTSTSEDYKTTWTVKYEDAESGQRFTIKVDIPNLIDNRFMKLRGNEKVLQGQWMLLPATKTDDDTVQMVSNYNKIFLRRKSPNGLGKSSAIVNRLSKALTKYTGKGMKVIEGSNKKICVRYELPIEFVDMADMFSKIEFADGDYISFNMDDLSKIDFDRDLLPDAADKKAPLEELNKKYMGYYVHKGKRVPLINNKDVGLGIWGLINEKVPDFDKTYKLCPVSKRLMYSEASILQTTMPAILIPCYCIGLQKLMEKMGLIYHFSEKRVNGGDEKLVFRFNDGYLWIDLGEQPQNIDPQNIRMFYHGLQMMDTENYSIKQVNEKEMWLDMLDDFGGRLKADGLDNFYDLMIDPITKDVCDILKIPDQFIELLIYSNNLLTDNKYISHNDIRGNRLRVNEIIVGHLYLVLARQFGMYETMIKRSKTKALFDVKRSAVIDSILNHDQTSSDLSSLTPLLEAEMAAQTTWKGLSGMNSDRAFSVDKRMYDKSMLGVVGMSTGFAGTVGITRQTTIDAGVLNKRGFIASKDPKDLDTTNSFTIMEAMSPMSITHNDPFRTAMAFTQTSKHQMLVKKSMPNLVTTGADEALPYITSNKFSYKFKGKRGVVVDLTDEYMIIQDSDTKKKEFVDLRETIRKNSDGGFYVTTKLDPSFKKGQKLKYNDIVAYDRRSYSNAVGHQGDPQKLSYNIGTLAKVAIMNTDMGYEDSCVVDSSISEALSTDFCVQKEINLNAKDNIYNVVKIGQEIQEGDPLLIFQSAFDDDEDANELLANLAKENQDLSDLTRKQIRSKIAGKVQDIKVFRTCEIDALSPSLKKFVNEHESRINKLKKVMQKNGIHQEFELEPTYKLAQEGKLKHVEGVRIEFYIKETDKFGIGDKLVFDQALKGVNSYIIPEEESAYTDYHPNEHINAFLTISGVMGRMVGSSQLVGLSNKLMIELARQCQEILGIKWKPLQDILRE